MTTGIANTVGVRRTETCLVVWSGQEASPGTTQQTSVAPPPAPEVFDPLFDADAFYDAGNKGCGEGPLDKIAALMRKLEPGQTLEIRATDPSVTVDLSAWCRMTGHTLVDQQRDRFLVRRK